MVSNRMSEHYEAEHPAAPEPEKQGGYVLASPLLNEATRQIAFRHVCEQLSEVEWKLVDRLEDVPEAAPIVQAAGVLRAAMASEKDPPKVRQVRWYTRRGHDLVFTPTKKQIDESRRAR